MNILFFAYTFDGGVGRVTDILAKELQKRGHSIYYLCGCEMIQNTDFKTFYLNGKATDPINNEELKKYRSILCQLNINVIINQYPLHKRGDILFRNTPSTIKKIAFYHGKPLQYIKYNLSSIHIHSIKDVKNLLYWSKRFLIEKHRFQEIGKVSDIFCCLSYSFIEIIRPLLRLADQQKLKAIGNPNTFSIQETTHYSLSNKENIILFIGRINDPVKNLKGFIEVWKLLWEKNPTWRVLIVGDDSRCESLKISLAKQRINNIEFTGKLQNVADIYKRAKIICITSHSEGWPMVLTEGMSYGCVPCVYATFESANEIITQQEDGILIPPYQTKTMADSIQYLINHPSILRQMAINARSHIKKFDVTHIVDKWESILY